MTRLICFAVPDEGEWVAVPKVALQDAEESLGSFCSGHDWTQDDMDNMDRLSAILAAPPCKVVELPERQSDETAYVAEKYVHRREGWNDYRTEIERRAKG